MQGQSQLGKGVGEGKALVGLKPEAVTTTLMAAHFRTSGLEAGHSSQSPGHRIAVFHGTRAHHMPCSNRPFPLHCTGIAGNAVVDSQRIVTTSEGGPKFSWF